MSKRRQQKLDWTNKKYTTIPPALIQQQSYTNVVELRLSNNALKELPWEILAQAMPNLRSLWLNRNEFAELPAGVAQLNSLRKIHLEDNKIVTITPQISKLEELRKLYLNNNKLIQLPTEMHKLTQLTRLNVSNNSLKIIPSEFYCLTQLKTLNIDNNPVISPPPFMCASGTIPLLNFLRQQYDSLQKRGNRHNISSASLKNLPMDDGSRSGGKTPPMSKRTSTRPRDRERERSNSLTVTTFSNAQTFKLINLDQTFERVLLNLFKLITYACTILFHSIRTSPDPNTIFNSFILKFKLVKNRRIFYF
jgi:hypothetical protein